MGPRLLPAGQPPPPLLALAGADGMDSPSFGNGACGSSPTKSPDAAAAHALVPWHVEHQPRERRGAPENCPFPELSLLSIFF